MEALEAFAWYEFESVKRFCCRCSVPRQWLRRGGSACQNRGGPTSGGSDCLRALEVMGFDGLFE